MSNDLSVLGRNPWIFGYSDLLPIYSGKDGCLNHWVSWNRSVIDDSTSKQQSLQPPTPGDNAVDVTPSPNDIDNYNDDYPTFT